MARTMVMHEDKDMTADIKLPPLPECAICDPGRWGIGWRAEQMTAYATAAVLADRERVEGVMRMALEALQGYRREIGALTGSRAMDPCDAENALREHLKG